MVVSQRLRFAIFKRDGFACQYCGRRAPFVELQCDHVYPASRGGSDHPSNLATACSECNLGKSNILLPSQVEGQFGDFILNCDPEREVW